MSVQLADYPLLWSSVSTIVYLLPPPSFCFTVYPLVPHSIYLLLCPYIYSTIKPLLCPSFCSILLSTLFFCISVLLLNRYSVCLHPSIYQSLLSFFPLVGPTVYLLLCPCACPTLFIHYSLRLSCCLTLPLPVLQFMSFLCTKVYLVNSSIYFDVAVIILCAYYEL